jgi:hypothetical protein
MVMHKVKVIYLLAAGLAVSAGSAFLLTGINAHTSVAGLGWRLGLFGLSVAIMLTTVSVSASSSSTAPTRAPAPPPRSTPRSSSMAPRSWPPRCCACSPPPCPSAPPCSRSHGKEGSPDGGYPLAITADRNAARSCACSAACSDFLVTERVAWRSVARTVTVAHRMMDAIGPVAFVPDYHSGIASFGRHAVHLAQGRQSAMCCQKNNRRKIRHAGR